ncbi:MAG: transposase, partial [Elusimicrobiota bacterium]
MNSITKIEEIEKGKLAREWLKGLDDEFDKELRRKTVTGLKKLIETSLEVEVVDLIGSDRWEHNPNRKTYRNGYYQRNLLTSMGYIAGINVPRVREGRINWK